MLRNLLIIIFLLGIVVPGYAQKKSKKKKKGATEQTTDTVKIDHKTIGSQIPDFRVYTRKEEILTNKDFKDKGNLFVMMFNPTCDHCQEQVFIFEKNIHLFDKSKVLLICGPELHSYLEFFNNVTKYSRYPSLNVGVDSSNFIQKVYMYEALPQINVYDKDRKLIKVFQGETPIDMLKSYIE